MNSEQDRAAMIEAAFEKYNHDECGDFTDLTPQQIFTAGYTAAEKDRATFPPAHQPADSDEDVQAFQPFNIEKEFQLYCERSRLNLDTCPPVQGIETRRAFYGAVGQLLIYLRDDLAAEAEDDCVAELGRIFKQVASFWERQGRS